MSGVQDRRAFLRRAAAALCAAGGAAGCRFEQRPQAARDTPTTPEPLGRPILTRWTDGVVRMEAPLAEQPMAYVSRSEMRIYVDAAFRERVYWLLDAHISVSTGVWRIPFLTDSPLIPITPGDALREFEEFGLQDWSPDLRPVEGDVRILRGERVDRTLAFDCAPVAGEGTWVSAGPMAIGRCDGPPGRGCREEFGRVGWGRIHAARYCAEPTGEVELVSWACPRA